MAQQQLARKTEARPRGSSIRRRTSMLGYLLVAPVVICLLVLVVYPFAFAIWISFTDRVIGRPGQFVGLANFAYLFGQPSFQATVRNAATTQRFTVSEGQTITLTLDLMP